MTPLTESMAQVTSAPTQHALLVVWGHFAQTLDLYARLTLMPLAQKTVHHTRRQVAHPFPGPALR